MRAVGRLLGRGTLSSPPASADPSARGNSRPSVTVRCNLLPNRVWGHKVRQIKACMGNQRRLLEIGLWNGGHIDGCPLDETALVVEQYDVRYIQVHTTHTGLWLYRAAEALSVSHPCCRAAGASDPTYSQVSGMVPSVRSNHHLTHTHRPSTKYVRSAA